MVAEVSTGYPKPLLWASLKFGYGFIFGLRSASLWKSLASVFKSGRGSLLLAQCSQASLSLSSTFSKSNYLTSWQSVPSVDPGESMVSTWFDSEDKTLLLICDPMKLNCKIVIDFKMSSISLEFSPVSCASASLSPWFGTYTYFICMDSCSFPWSGFDLCSSGLLEALCTAPPQPGTGRSPLCRGACYVRDYLPDIWMNI